MAMMLKSLLLPIILKEVKLNSMKEAIQMRRIMLNLMEMQQMETMELCKVLLSTSHIMDR